LVLFTEEGTVRRVDVVWVPLGDKAENDMFRGLFRPEDPGEGNLPLIADCGGDGATRGGKTSSDTNFVIDPEGPASANVTTGAVLGKKRPPALRRSGALSSLAGRFPRAISLAPASLAKICRSIFTDFSAIGVRPAFPLFSDRVKNWGVMIGTREDFGNGVPAFGDTWLKVDASSEDRTLRTIREECLGR